MVVHKIVTLTKHYICDTLFMTKKYFSLATIGALWPHFTHFARKFMKFQRSSERNHWQDPVPVQVLIHGQIHGQFQLQFQQG